MLANRLRKNLRRTRKWARREGVHCYRVYDGDIPEYNFAIDWYDGAVRVEEAEPPRGVDPERAERHRRDALHVVPEVLGVDPEAVVLRVRRRQSGGGQYQKLGDLDRFRAVREDDLRFWVNLTDYLDTGLFLDHRILRRRIREAAAGRRFLNLYAYTCTASVHAAAAGAAATTSVDLSNTYLDWGRRNFELNRVPTEGAHRFVRRDVMRFLAEDRHTYDLVLAAPPIYSRSKAMEGDFDVQRDHVALIRALVQRLAPGGLLLFSNPLRGFVLDRSAFADLEVRDITRETVPADFSRMPYVHQAWAIRRR